ncbi:hypothetical protein AB4259_22660, partial [Vibrio amylolyticus]|uniref:hypothetical protein n=1 Tax=Vibrio amylolyticus TaxID=2847292 RepID=UPI00355424C5
MKIVIAKKTQRTKNRHANVNALLIIPTTDFVLIFLIVSNSFSFSSINNSLSNAIYKPNARLRG